MAQRLPSLELVAREVDTQLQEQFRHFEGLDTKAGIVLGFAGVLVALSDEMLSPWRIGAVLVALIAALLAVLAFLPRDFPVLNVSEFRDSYLTAEAEFTTLFLLDTRVEMWRQGAEILRSKALRLKLALVALTLAAIGAAGSMLFE